MKKAISLLIILTTIFLLCIVSGLAGDKKNPASSPVNRSVYTPAVADALSTGQKIADTTVHVFPIDPSKVQPLLVEQKPFVLPDAESHMATGELSPASVPSVTEQRIEPFSAIKSELSRLTVELARVESLGGNGAELRAQIEELRRQLPSPPPQKEADITKHQQQGGMTTVLPAATTTEVETAPPTQNSEADNLSAEERTRMKIEVLTAERARLVDSGADAAEIDEHLTQLREILAGRLNVGQGGRDSGNPLDQGGETCAAAVVISSIPYTDTGTLSGRTDDCVGIPYQDVFYRYTAPASGSYTADMCSSAGDTYLRIWLDGTCCSGSSITADDECGSLAPTRTFSLNCGQTIYIECGYYYTSGGAAYNFHLTGPAIRACNSCTPADVALGTITSTPWGSSVSGSMCNAGKWVGSFTATAGEVFHFDLCPDAPGSGTANIDIDIRIFNSGCTQLVYQDGTCTALSYRPNDFTWTATATGTFYVELASYYTRCTSSNPNETFTMYYYRAVAGPANDNCANAGSPVSLPATVTGDNTGATHDVGSCSGLNMGNGQTWHAFSLSQICNVVVEYCNTNSAWNNFYIVMAQGCPCASLAYGTYDFSCANGNAKVYFDNLAAGTYYLPVLRDDANGSVGAYSVYVYCHAAGNDACASAAAVSIPSQTTGTTISATSDAPPASDCVTAVSASGLWYKVVGTGNTLTATTCNAISGYDTKLNVYACGCSGLACVTGNDDNCSGYNGLLSTVSWCSRSGQEYWILVQGYSGATGGFRIDNSDDGTPCNTYYPGQVTGVSASDNSCNTVEISWSDLSTETSYRVFRNGVQAGTTSANVLTFSDTPSPGSYSYTVAAIGACNDGAISAADAGTRLATPAQVTGASASTNLCNSVLATWSNVANESGYYVYRDATLIGSTGSDVLTFTDSSPLGGIHNYTVAAYNTCGTGTVSASASGWGMWDQTLTAPGSLSGTTAGDECSLRSGPDHVIKVAIPSAGYWNFSLCGSDWDSYLYVNTGCCSDNACNNDDYYCNGSWTLQSACPCVNLPSAGIYYVDIESFNQSSMGNYVLNVQQTAIPTQVTSVAASDAGCDNISITWSDVSNEIGYYLYRDALQIAWLGMDAISYTDYPSPGTYGYTVKAWNGCGEGVLSVAENGTRLNTPAQAALSSPESGITVCSGVSQDYCWNAVSGATLYRVQWDDDVNFGSPEETTTGALCLAKVLSQGGMWYWRVRAESACPGGTWSNARTVTVDASSPVNSLAAFDARPSDLGVWLKWQWTYNSTTSTVMETWRSPYTGDYPTYPTNKWSNPADTNHYEITYNELLSGGWAKVVTQDGVSATTSLSYSGLNGKSFCDHADADTNYWLDADALWDTTGAEGVGAERRDIYRYASFVKSACGLWSRLAGGYAIGSNADRSTNYWLGDYTMDVSNDPDGSSGAVNTADKILLSQDYFEATVANEGTAANHIDIGPENSENGMGKGIPSPNGFIDFDDLVPFSVNFGSVGQRAFRAQPRQDRPSLHVDDLPIVLLKRNDEQELSIGSEFEIVVSIEGNSANGVRAVEAELHFDPDAFEVIEIHTAEVEALNGIPFTVARPIAGSIDIIGIACAALGETASLEGDITLAILRFRLITSNHSHARIELRNVRLADLGGSIINGAGSLLALGIADPLPMAFALHQNFPNPFNPSTTIRFDLPEAADVSLIIYNILGQEIRTLMTLRMEAGRQSAIWNGLNNNGQMTGSGLYVCRLTAGDFVDTRKMLLMR
jgi:hypothetical protein